MHGRFRSCSAGEKNRLREGCAERAETPGAQRPQGRSGAPPGQDVRRGAPPAGAARTPESGIVTSRGAAEVGGTALPPAGREAQCGLRRARRPWQRRARPAPSPPVGRLTVSLQTDQSRGARGGPPGPRPASGAPLAARTRPSSALTARWRVRGSSPRPLLMPARGGSAGAGPGAVTHGAVTQRDGGGGGGGGGRCGRREGSSRAGERATAVAVA